MISGGAENHPEGGAIGDIVTVGAGGGGGVGANPGPLLAAHDTFPAPSTTCTTTRICSFVMAAGTASEPTNEPPLEPRSRLCQSPPAWYKATARWMPEASLALTETFAKTSPTDRCSTTSPTFGATQSVDAE